MKELEEKSIIGTCIPDGQLYQEINIRKAIDFKIAELKKIERRCCGINRKIGFEKYLNYEFKMK